MQEMWDKLFTPEMVVWMNLQTGETEDFDTISGFAEHVKAKIDYKQVVILATQWRGMEEKRQVNIAITFAGVFHASRFMLMMDFLSKRFIEGKLR